MLQVLKKAMIPMYFYMFWGFAKLGLYALSAYGLIGLDPYEGIIYFMVLIHVLGGLGLLALERHYYRKTVERLSAPVS